MPPAMHTTKTYVDLESEHGDMIEIRVVTVGGPPDPKAIELMVQSCLSGLSRADSGLILACLDGNLEKAQAWRALRAGRPEHAG